MFSQSNQFIHRTFIRKSLINKVYFSGLKSDGLKIPRFKIKKLLDSDESIIGQEVLISGWVRTIRDQKNFAFIEINDGSSVQGMQSVLDAKISTFSEIKNLRTGAAAEITGIVVKSLGKGQSFEIQANKVKIIGECPEDYPLQKKRHSQEFLRTIAHLRARTNTISAVSRVRSSLAFATHEYFQKEGFIFVQTPLITASDCEGAGEMFRVTSLPLENPDSIPRLPGKPSQTDFSKDFFSRPAYLTVSGQLSAETQACALGDVYTFGPTFRAENSQTSRHLAEFHMIEPEMAFCDLHQAMDNAEGLLKHTVQHALQTCPRDFDFFEKFLDKNLKSKLTHLLSVPFPRISYREAVRLLQIEIAKDPSKWQFPIVEFGTDLQTEHERWLSESHFQGCVFVHSYPRSIKAFYMRDSDPNYYNNQQLTHDDGSNSSTKLLDGLDERTVDSFDLLVPGVGELVGGSQREERLEILRKKMKDFNLKEEDYWWYLDLRRYGSVPHAGYGLGFERLVCFVTGVENIREAIAFPRARGLADF